MNNVLVIDSVLIDVVDTQKGEQPNRMSMTAQGVEFEL